MESDHHNLQEITSDVNGRYFGGALDLRVQWHGSKSALPRTQIKLGSYNHETKVIRINRLLDRPTVPKYFVEFIVYHEMLHNVLPPIIIKNRRRRIHHPAFLQREKEFQDYALAKKFLDEEVKRKWLARRAPPRPRMRDFFKWWGTA